MISVCPADEIAAPVDCVWALLDDPRAFDAWWDARVVRATPPGPMTPGQQVVARAKGVFPARVGYEVIAVDRAQHRLELRARLPFGVVDHFVLTVAARGPDRAFVRFG